MGLTRLRDLVGAAVAAAVVGYLAAALAYPRLFPPITVWSGLSLLIVAIAVGAWAFYVRGKIRDGEIGDGPGWLHPLAVARSVTVAKASAWVGALVTGWWAGILVHLLPQRGVLRAADQDTAGVAVAVASALALGAAGVWLQHSCKSPHEPPENGDTAPD